MMEQKFTIKTERVKEMTDTEYIIESSSGKRRLITCEGGSWSGYYGSYEYRLRGHPTQSWTYPHYAIVKAIKTLKGDVVSASIKYKRKDQIQILVNALYREGVLRHQFYENHDEVLIVPI